MSLRGYSRRDSAAERRLRQWLGIIQAASGRLNNIPGIARLRGALAPLRWPDRWQGWNRGPLATLAPSQRVLAVAITVSVVLHAVLLAIHFKLPDVMRQMSNQTLEVVLVNSKSRTSPVKPDVLAQANLDGGGNTDDNRRAKTPLPVLPNTAPGVDVTQAQRRIQELEAQQRQVLTQTQPKPAASAEPVPAPVAPEPKPKPLLSGADLAAQTLAIARLEAQISRNLDDYNKRPRKNFVGIRAAEYRFTRYEEDWRQKVERIGSINYPEAARGKMYGSLQLTVNLRSDGTIESIELGKSSGYRVLDEAAERIVRMAAPYAPFPPDVRKDTDILVITRTWHFAQGDRLFGE